MLKSIPPRVRLFILSGQSNMVGLDPATTFTPAIQAAFPHDQIIVVKNALGGKPIARWYKAWQSPAGIPAPADTAPIGDLYDRLMEDVRKAVGDSKPDTVTFVWMQGERDAKEFLSAVYEASLRGLIQQLRCDLGRPDTTFVIGRISNHLGGQPHWDAVRQIHVKVAKSDPLGAWVDTDDLNGPANDLHYVKPEGYAELGRRFAAKAVETLSTQPATASAPACR